MSNLRRKGRAAFLSLWIGLFFLPSLVYAVIPPLRDFGGFSLFEYPCTCSATLWHWFVPLFLTSVPVTGPVVYVPYATVPFANYTLQIPEVEFNGAYVPGVQACWQYAGYTCVVMPSVGAMAFAGVGLPGGY